MYTPASYPAEGPFWSEFYSSSKGPQQQWASIAHDNNQLKDTLFIGFPSFLFYSPDVCELESSLTSAPCVQASASITVWENSIQDTGFSTNIPLGGEKALRIVVQIINIKVKLLYLLELV